MCRAETLVLAVVLASGCTLLNRIDTCDVPRDGDRQVNVSTSGDQAGHTARSLVALPSGRYIAAWGSQPGASADSPRHLMAITLTAEGERFGCGRPDHEVQISKAADEIVLQHAVAVGDAEGSAVYFAWSATKAGAAGGTPKIFVRLLKTDLCPFSPDERVLQLSEDGELAGAPSVAVRRDGREALVAWISGGLPFRIRSRPVGVTIDAFGALARNCVGVDAPCTHGTMALASPPALAPFDTGYALAWAESRSGLSDGRDLRLELLTDTSASSKRGKGVRPYGNVENVRVAVISAGDSVWVAHAGEPFPSVTNELDAEVFLERFGADAISLGPPAVVNASQAGHQRSPALALLPGGDVFVSWTTEGLEGANGLYGRVLDANGSPRFSGLACDTADFALSSRPNPTQMNASLALSGGYVGTLFTDTASAGDIDGQSVQFRRFELERLFPKPR